MENSETNINVSEVLADYSLSLKFSDLTPEAIEAAKLMFFDVVGVSIVGTQGKPCRILRNYIINLGGQEESTIIGGGRKVWTGNAALANGIALRYPEYCGHLQTKDTLMAIHCEENTPSILAVAEKLKLGGEDCITALVLAAELQGMIGMVASMEHECGIRHTTASIFVVPLVAGKLMGLSRDQMINAFGISGSFGLTLHQCHSGEHVVPVRDMVYGLGAQNGIRGAELAQLGFEGPKEIFEGKWGFLKALGVEGIRARRRLTKFIEKREYFLINRYGHKMKVGDGTTQTAAESILDIANSQDVEIDDVKKVKLFLKRAHVYEALENSDRKYPINKEDADHSLWYICARALIDRDLQHPEQFTEEKIRDPKVIELIDKIEYYVDPQLDAEDEKLGPPAASSYAEVEMKDGTLFRSKRIQYVNGYGPLKSAKAIKEHFVNLASKYIQMNTVNEISKMIDNFEKESDVGNLMELIRSLGGGRLAIE